MYFIALLLPVSTTGSWNAKAAQTPTAFPDQQVGAHGEFSTSRSIIVDEMRRGPRRDVECGSGKGHSERSRRITTRVAAPSRVSVESTAPGEAADEDPEDGSGRRKRKDEGKGQDGDAEQLVHE